MYSLECYKYQGTLDEDITWQNNNFSERNITNHSYLYNTLSSTERVLNCMYSKPVAGFYTALRMGTSVRLHRPQQFQMCGK